ncbi:MAG TPA: hypothetical protein K8V56_14885 [Sporosarcina psychrophila]|uniref:Glucose-6-phosphate dehydrogenase NAD-binding domain-containing protein n=1 Tax=Sporosarcina psychrophila TaxID=1476 RepID=A0A921G0N3_SPOPS|nr:hypothetical protein [Sporosarcina psychrophila]
MNYELSKVSKEEENHRIDHYLDKQMVGNLEFLSLRIQY